MKKNQIFLVILISIITKGAVFGQKIILKKSNGIHPLNTEIIETKHKGKSALKVKAIVNNKTAMVLLPNTDFTDGTIEFEMATNRAADAHPENRGFAGLAFHLNTDNTSFDCIYLRATNGRADDQVRRNHTVQYMASPNFDFGVLREKFPEKYETYVDMVPDEWTKIRIEINNRKVKLFVHNQEQPTLVVNDMLNQNPTGGIALWVGGGTEAYFRKLKISKVLLKP